ncbi:formyl transferase [Sphingomonas sp.]|uniref:glucosamine inositolphosphorylceramide transferase family protein n=1 Tax=Sphingomonas sp. TaxID=28214 RepID=UPI0035C834D5
MEFVKDIWRPAIVAAPIHDLAKRGTIAGSALHWFPDQGPMRYLADPFALWRDGRLHVFAEFFDYREARGRIDLCVFDDRLRFVEQRVVLQEPWHLSYPYVFEAEGETWMLPEAFQSGGLTLYRARDFPLAWEPVSRIDLAHVPLDATPVFHQGRWWLFYAPAYPERDRLTVLHAAYADQLRGPWCAHPANPVYRAASGARPGGTPFVRGGHLVLPIQDSSRSYGGALRFLTIAALTPERFVASIGAPFAAPADLAPFNRGLHTLSAAGAVTLLDVKRGVTSWNSLTMRPRREWQRLRARLARQSSGL